MWCREQECASCEGSKLHSLSLVSRLRFPPYSHTLKTEACLLIILLSPSSVLDGLGWGWGLVILSLRYQLPQAATTATATKTSLKKRTRATSNYVAFFPSRSIRQIMANFSTVDFVRTVSKFREKKRKLLFCIHVLDKTLKSEEVSRWARATTAKKCTKMRDARAKLSFCWSKPIAFFPFSFFVLAFFFAVVFS